MGKRRMGKLHRSVRLITEREIGRLIRLAERCTKTGERVMEVLRTKHPEALPKKLVSLYTYPDRPPEIISVDITNNTVKVVVGRLSVGAGPGGTDSVSIQQ